MPRTKKGKKAKKDGDAAPDAAAAEPERDQSSSESEEHEPAAAPAPAAPSPQPETANQRKRKSRTSSDDAKPPKRPRFQQEGQQQQEATGAAVSEAVTAEDEQQSRAAATAAVVAAAAGAIQAAAQAAAAASSSATSAGSASAPASAPASASSSSAPAQQATDGSAGAVPAASHLPSSLAALLGPLQQLRSLLLPMVESAAASSPATPPPAAPARPAQAAGAAAASPAAEALRVWGKLTSQTLGVRSLALSTREVHVGRSRRCTHVIEDAAVPSVAFKVSQGVAGAGATITAIAQNTVAHNKHVLAKGASVPLRGGDELRINNNGKGIVFVFVASPEVETAPATAAVGVTPDAQRARQQKGLRDSFGIPAAGAAAAAGLIAAAEVLQPRKTAAPLEDDAGGDQQMLQQQGQEQTTEDGAQLPPAAPIGQAEPMDDEEDDEDAEMSPSYTARSRLFRFQELIPVPVPLVTPAVAAPTTQQSTPPPQIEPGSVSGLVQAAADQLAPITAQLPALLPTNAAGQQPAAQGQPAVAGQDELPAKERYRQQFQKALMRPSDIDTSFDSFPYFLSEDVKQMLISSTFIFLCRPQFSNYAQDLPCVSRKMLLSGPPGTELYEEAMVRALAKHVGATVLTVDASDLESRTAMRSEAPVSAPTSRAGLAAAVLGLDLQQPGYSSEDDDFSDSRTFLLEPRQRKSFKRDDRVKFVGGGPPQPPAAQLDTHPVIPGGTAAITQPGAAPPKLPERGPPVGAKGTVILAFEDNPRRVGVVFDQVFPGGVDLGGMCDEGHGYFVETQALVLEDDNTEDEKMALEAIFELLSENSPAILLLKSADRTLLATQERYALFKKHLVDLSKSQTATVVIGATTNASVYAAVEAANANASRERSGSQKHSAPLLFSSSRGAGHHTAVLDFSLLDHMRGGGGGGHSSGGEGLFGLSVGKESIRTTRLLSKLLPARVLIVPPKDPAKVVKWKEQVDRDVECVKSTTNKLNLAKILLRNNIVCDELPIHLLKKQIFGPESVEKIIGWALSTELQSGRDVTLRDGVQLQISAASVERAITMLTSHDGDSRKKTLADVETENDFEKRLLSEVIPPDEVNLSFDDIGALDDVKESLKELVMLPLQRPELFRKGNLKKPCKGILLFGPPGTGKTMLAKAIATESGANFINVTMSTIASKWFGEGEKYVRAVFSLASKISPSVIFVDEVDSILGKRERNGEHEAMRKIKNEFMMNWDGLRTRQGERVLVLAATNRPMDLDDAVLRRLSRRLLVDLPTAENRAKILKVILEGEDLAPGFDIESLARSTEGFSGSDLKNLCVTAAYQPIRELLANERLRKQKEAQQAQQAQAQAPAAPLHVAEPVATSTVSTPAQTEPIPDVLNDSAMQDVVEHAVTPAPIPPVSTPEAATLSTSTAGGVQVGQASAPGAEPQPELVLRPLTMTDFEKTLKEVSKSVHEDAFSLSELRKWNEMYGDSGSRTKSQSLPYFM